MSLLTRAHDGYVHPRRVRRLAACLSELMEQGATVLDVGCGDGLLTSLIARKRPDLHLVGVECLARRTVHSPVVLFDGKHLPYSDAEWDVVMFIDTLHHAQDASALLKEGARVARRVLVIKDHLAQGWMAEATLEFMDRVGNAHHDVASPGHYWTEAEWRQEFRSLNLRVETWQTSLGLYPWPASLWFDRSLHFVARVRHSD